MTTSHSHSHSHSPSTERAEDLGTGVNLWTQWKLDAWVILKEEFRCEKCGSLWASPNTQGMKIRLVTDRGESRLMNPGDVQKRYLGLHVVLENGSAFDWKWPDLPVVYQKYQSHLAECSRCQRDRLETWMAEGLMRTFAPGERYLPREKEQLQAIVAPQIASNDGFIFESIDASLIKGGNLRPEKKKKKSRKAQQKKAKAVVKFDLAALMK